MTDDEAERRDRKTEEEGATWQRRTDEFLVGYVTSRTAGFHTPAIVEMQRRQAVAVREFNEKSGRLAWGMIALTVAMGVLAGLQLWAVLRGGA